MAMFKYTTTDEKIIHITSGNIESIMIEEEGSWSHMSQEEYEEFMNANNEEADKNPLPIVEPEELTPQQKLEKAGLSVEELKELLGL